MSKSRGKTRWSLIVILLVALGLSYFGFKYFMSSSPFSQPAGVFVVEQTPISYGPVTLTGSIRKELSSNGKDNYILITDTGSAVSLDVAGIDHLVGKKVVVEGVRLPVDPETGVLEVLKVSTITLEITK